MLILIFISFIIVFACVMLLDNWVINGMIISLWLIFSGVIGFLYVKHKKMQAESNEGKLDILIREANKSQRKEFRNIAQLLVAQYKSIETRGEYIAQNSDSNIQNIYDKILEQAESNINTAISYIRQYDYYTNPPIDYLVNLSNHGDMLVKKFNALIQQLIDIDTNPTQLDMTYVDDVISCLEDIKNL